MAPQDLASRDALNAFVPGKQFKIAGRPGGPLAGLAFAAKDIFDLEGRVTGCGNPDWALSHDAAPATASGVAKLLAAGADLFGKTITDELAFSLMGENAHYGTPLNSAAPGRVPGGSSSGSAAAVAGGACDVALGSDTGGSVRIPASHCGLYGIRTTHGRIALDGTMPLAPSFDTLGWFARDAATMRRVGPVLLGAPPPQAKPAGLLYAEDLFERADPAVAAALAPAVARVERVLGPRRTVAVAPGTAAGGLDAWFQAIRPLQGHEIWQAHGEWVGRVDPSFGPGVAERFQWVRTIGRDEVAAAQAVRAQVRRHLAELLAGGLILCLPTSPAPAPLKGLPLPETERFRARAIQFTCIAGLAGLPQISLPLARAATPEGSAPVGLSLIAAAGGDETLLDLAEKIATV